MCREDFGYSGDEIFLRHCTDDYIADMLDLRGDMLAEERQSLAEDDWEFDDDCPEDAWDNLDESMDGDHDSALTSVGWGTDEDYGYYGENDEW